MHDMLDFFAVAEGPYGRVEVVVVHTHLTTHSHPYTHFTFWLGGGKVESRVGTQQVQLGTHQALGINSHVSHDMRLLDVDEKAFVLNLYINDEWLDAQFCETSKPMVLNRPGIDITPAVQAACFQLLGDLSSPMQDRSLRINKDVTSLVTQTMAACMTPADLSAMPQRRRLIDPRLRQAMAHLQAHLDSPGVTEELPELLGLSRSRLYALFHDELGSSPSVYWNAMRTEAARTGLMAQTHNMTTLAMDLGFSTPGNFSRAFKDHLGVSPSTYRRVCHAI